MIKANELMIGNIVKVGEEICVVESPNVDGRIELSYGKFDCLNSVEQVNGIELCAKVFQALGFTLEHDTIVDCYEWVSEDGLIKIGGFGNSIGRDFSVHIDNQDFQTIGGGDVQYLHQLQNLIIVCTGKELVVDIDKLN